MNPLEWSPPAAWSHVGATTNADFYAVGPDVLAVVPHLNSHDGEATARASVAFQDAYWRRVGHRGAAIVLMDRVIEQDSGARAVYANETAQTLATCYALVGETFFGHATAAVFTGLARPGIPTQVFRSVEDALPWIAEMNAARGGPL